MQMYGLGIRRVHANALNAHRCGDGVGHGVAVCAHDHRCSPRCVLCALEVFCHVTDADTVRVEELACILKRGKGGGQFHIILLFYFRLASPRDMLDLAGA